MDMQWKPAKNQGKAVERKWKGSGYSRTGQWKGGGKVSGKLGGKAGSYTSQCIIEAGSMTLNEIVSFHSGFRLSR